MRLPLEFQGTREHRQVIIGNKVTKGNKAGNTFIDHTTDHKENFVGNKGTWTLPPPPGRPSGIPLHDADEVKQVIPQALASMLHSGQTQKHNKAYTERSS